MLRGGLGFTCKLTDLPVKLCTQLYLVSCFFMSPATEPCLSCISNVASWPVTSFVQERMTDSINELQPQTRDMPQYTITLAAAWHWILAQYRFWSTYTVLNNPNSICSQICRRNASTDFHNCQVDLVNPCPAVSAFSYTQRQQRKPHTSWAPARPATPGCASFRGAAQVSATAYKIKEVARPPMRFGGSPRLQEM